MDYTVSQCAIRTYCSNCSLVHTNTQAHTHTLNLFTLEIEYPKVSHCTRLDERNGIIRTAVKHLAVSAFLQRHTGTRKQERRLTHPNWTSFNWLTRPNCTSFNWLRSVHTHTHQGVGHGNDNILFHTCVRTQIHLYMHTYTHKHTYISYIHTYRHQERTHTHTHK